ncbi:hypothetical protein BDV95DRAFT_334910 [Massariosphaeria phaeospora]|uniref:Uncharacterized protein n=1 Tax=Massariosphaeria phaeospora TaxID=100035 RepID=A0A7C8ICD4_9PLEO|nr:hypothetical protein BDV95DRAFT_334910 [Massariosphaeria phaeospora]
MYLVYSGHISSTTSLGNCTHRTRRKSTPTLLVSIIFVVLHIELSSNKLKALRARFRSSQASTAYYFDVGSTRKNVVHGYTTCLARAPKELSKRGAKERQNHVCRVKSKITRGDAGYHGTHALHSYNSTEYSATLLILNEHNVSSSCWTASLSYLSWLVAIVMSLEYSKLEAPRRQSFLLPELYVVYNTPTPLSQLSTLRRCVVSHSYVIQDRRNPIIYSPLQAR